MKSTALRILLATGLSLAVLGASAAPAPSAAQPADYKVFIDAPTGYAFVKTPARWVFVRKIDATRIAETSAAARVEKADASR
jgi:hypothetical protein